MDPDQNEVADTSPAESELAVIAGLTEEFSAISEEPSEGAPDTPQLEGANEAPPEEVVAEAAPVVEEEKADPAVEKGFERLVEREVALQKREEVIKGFESREAEYKARIAELEGRPNHSDVLTDLGTSPMKALKAAGHDPDQVVRLYLAEKMKAEGKEVPAELERAIEKANTAAELRALRMEQQRYQQQQAAQAFVAQVEAGAQQYVTKGDFKNAPTVASVAKANPGRIYAEIMDEIARDASSPGKDPKAPVLSYEEAATRVEKRWADFRALLGGPAPGASTTAATPPARTAAPTKPSATVAPKPLTKPAFKSERELIDSIARETEMEFRKASKSPTV